MGYIIIASVRHTLSQTLAAKRTQLSWCCRLQTLPGQPLVERAGVVASYWLVHGSVGAPLAMKLSWHLHWEWGLKEIDLFEKADQLLWRPLKLNSKDWPGLTLKVVQDELCDTVRTACDSALSMVWLCSLPSDSTSGSKRSEGALQVLMKPSGNTSFSTNHSPQPEGIVQWPPFYWPCCCARLVLSSQTSFLAALTSFLPTYWDQVFTQIFSWYQTTMKLTIPFRLLDFDISSSSAKIFLHR